jgi:IS605 OrfB family transposase
VILTFRYRLLPPKSQHRALERLCASQRELYNAALEERIDYYRKTKQTRTYIDQFKALTQCRRELADMGELPVNVQRWTLKRVDDAFQGVFRRCKARSARAGFPRFRGKSRWAAFGFAEFKGIRFGRQASQRSAVACRHTRATWLHQQSSALVKRADLIAVEDLKVANMVRHPTLARSISDASWSRFVSMLGYKAEKAGSYLIRVDPRNISQKCSGCGELVPKSLAVRTHACPSCGLVIDRDYNASLNILRAGIGAGALNVIGWR